MVKKRHVFLEELINEVLDNPPLWDKGHKEFKNVVTKTQAWNEILANMRANFPQEDLAALKMNSIEDLKNQWKNLRDSYFRKRKVGYGNQESDDGQEKKEWIFFRMLQFLDNDGRYDPANRRLLRDESYSHESKKADESYLQGSSSKKRRLGQPNYEAPHWEAFTKACNRFAATSSKIIDDPNLAFGHYVGVQLQQMTPAVRKKAMGDILACLFRNDDGHQQVEVVVNVHPSGIDSQHETYTMTPTCSEITLASGAELMGATQDCSTDDSKIHISK